MLQTHWNQYRLIVPAYPLMILLLFSGIYYLLSLRKLRYFQILLFVPVIIISYNMLSDTIDARAKTRKLKNEYSDLTPDWFHYAKASAWSAENLPKEAIVACRKPSISTIYGKGKKFHGIHIVRSSNFDLFYDRWKADSLTFAIVAAEGMNDQLYNAMLGRIEARMLLGDKFYFAVKDKPYLQLLSAHFENMKIIETPLEFDPVVQQAGSQKSIYYADSLLVPLKRANVSHILLAKLRLNPNIKDGQTINTVERIFIFILEKYPAIFSELIQIGAQDNEPANIYQINWEVVEK